MKITYSAEVIKEIVDSEHFKMIVDSINKGGDYFRSIQFTFVRADFDEFIDFIKKLEFISKESRLDSIKEITIDMCEILYMDELVQRCN